MNLPKAAESRRNLHELDHYFIKDQLAYLLALGLPYA